MTDPPSPPAAALLASNECSPSASIPGLSRCGYGAVRGHRRASVGATAFGHLTTPAERPAAASAWQPSGRPDPAPGRTTAGRDGRGAGPVPGQRPHGHVGGPSQRPGLAAAARAGLSRWSSTAPTRSSWPSPATASADKDQVQRMVQVLARTARAAPARGPRRRPRPGHLPPVRGGAAGRGWHAGPPWPAQTPGPGR